MTLKCLFRALARPRYLSRNINKIFKRHLKLEYTLHRSAQSPYAEAYAPLLILHGLFGSKQNNRSINLGRSVYALDLRNHGDSPHDPNHTYLTMADDVEQFVHDHKLTRPILIGHSMGAKVAMTLALRLPRVVGALIPVDNAPIDATLMSDFPKYVQGLRRIEEARVTNASQADDILRKYEEALPIRQFLLTNLQRSKTGNHLQFRIPIEIIGASLDHLGDFPYKEPEEARYDGATLFIRGIRSRYVPDDVLPIIGRFFPRFEVKDVDSGHWVISERPDAFRQAVVEFIQRNDPPEESGEY